jgi:hypothetical protein
MRRMKTIEIAAILATAVAAMPVADRRAKCNPDKIDPRLADLLAQKPTRVATVAMANKTARVVWAITAREEAYRTTHYTCSINDTGFS